MPKKAFDLEPREILPYLRKGQVAIISTPDMKWTLLYVPIEVLNLVTQDWVEDQVRICYGQALSRDPFKVRECRNSTEFRLPPIITVPDERLWNLRDAIDEQFRKVRDAQPVPPQPEPMPESSPSAPVTPRRHRKSRNRPRRPSEGDFRAREEAPEPPPPELRTGDVKVFLSSSRTRIEIRSFIVAELGKQKIRSLVVEAYGMKAIAPWIERQDGKSLWSKELLGFENLIVPPIPPDARNNSNAASRLGQLLKGAYHQARNRHQTRAGQ